MIKLAFVRALDKPIWRNATEYGTSVAHKTKEKKEKKTDNWYYSNVLLSSMQPEWEGRGRSSPISPEVR